MQNHDETLMSMQVLVPPPQQPVGVASLEEWAAAEAKAGHEFPLDWKQVNAIYGSGWFDNLIWVLSPAVLPRAYHLGTFQPDYDEVFELLSKYGISQSVRTIVPIAWTRSGAEFYWVIQDRVNDPIVALLMPRDGEGESYSTTPSKLLLSLLNGTTHSSILPDNFPSGVPNFTPHR